MTRVLTEEEKAAKAAKAAAKAAKEAEKAAAEEQAGSGESAQSEDQGEEAPAEESPADNGLVKIVKQDGKFYTKPQLEPLTASELIISQDMTQASADDWIQRNSNRR